MRKLFYIFGLLCWLLVLGSENGFGRTENEFPQTQDTVPDEQAASEHTEKQFILSSGLENSNCLTPRTLQFNGNPVYQRAPKNILKQFHFLQLKEYDVQRKTHETTAVVQAIHCSTLLTGAGYHVFALRKIII